MKAHSRAIHGSTHTSCQSGRSYTGYSHKMSGICYTCRTTQPPVGRTRPTP
ncbi:hypothetical protein F383_01735 [Gossypium arboreum]|uniref:Uncharacterized protein n=1 Tax=Gossypium arboreum TaxID=29729 RepID=A0A0B0PIX6_GOSAR|nr:hypothetical protein F383_01735 [Gossypium arboreum]